MRLKSFIICFVLMIQISFAQERPTLKNAIAEYHFTLIVEWDQKDQEFLELQNHLLETRIRDLDGSITRKDIIEAFPGVDVFKIDRDLEMKNIFTFQDLRTYMETNPNQYAQGASWVGVGGMALGGAGLITLGVFILREAISLTKKARECRASGGYWSIEHICW